MQLRISLVRATTGPIRSFRDCAGQADRTRGHFVAAVRSRRYLCNTNCRSGVLETAISVGMGPEGTDNSQHSASKSVTHAHATGVTNFADKGLSDFAMAIIGDLHIEPSQMPLFHTARQQLRASMRGPPQAGEDSSSGVMRPNSRIVQLGDLGGYSNNPGSRASFDLAAAYLGGFGVRFALVTGNHDLEGAEFRTDEGNLAAWHQVFRQRHYWAERLGPVLCIGLSTTRFRSNAFSAHEVHIDSEQMEWFESVLASNTDVPVVVFTHAPPMGSGLKVVQEVHVKNRCAWLNHSTEPASFIRLVERYPNIRLWFSGHFHLSHDYVDSISVVGACAFVQTNVIGACNRDDARQSRLLRGDMKGYRLYTVDHDTGSERLDLQHSWADCSAPEPVNQQGESLSDLEGGWLCSQLECRVDMDGGSMDPAPGSACWFAVGPLTTVALQSGRLVEYDIATRSPIGIVCLDVGGGCRVRVVDKCGDELHHDGSDSDGGALVAALELHYAATGVVRRFERNAEGGFFRVFQQNKWKKRLEALQGTGVAV